jgi:hypothetical protein
MEVVPGSFTSLELPSTTWGPLETKLHEGAGNIAWVINWPTECTQSPLKPQGTKLTLSVQISDCVQRGSQCSHGSENPTPWKRLFPLLAYPELLTPRSPGILGQVMVGLRLVSERPWILLEAIWRMQHFQCWKNEKSNKMIKDGILKPKDLFVLICLQIN